MALLWPKPVAAATEGEGLSRAHKDSLRAAAARGDDIAVESVVIAAILRAPDEAEAILADAVRVAPAFAEQIAVAVRDAFPDLALGSAPDGADSTGVGAEGGAPPVELVPAVPIEIESAQMEREKEWSGEASLGATVSTGNTTETLLAAEFELRRERLRWTNELDTSLDYNSTGGETTAQRFLIDGESRYSFASRAFGFGTLEYKRDRFSGFDYQATGGLGLGYALLDRPALSLDLQAGPMVRRSKIDETNRIEDELMLGIESDFFWSLSDTAALSNETRILLAEGGFEVTTASDASRARGSEARNRTALTTAIIGDLSGRLSLDLEFVSDPPPGAKRLDTRTKAMLVYEF